MAAKRARVPCGVGACFWTARCSASKFDDAASARGRDLTMRTAGARIMSISGARRAQTGPGLPADALMTRAFGGQRWEGLLPGARTRAARTWRSPSLQYLGVDPRCAIALSSYTHHPQARSGLLARRMVRSKETAPLAFHCGGLQLVGLSRWLCQVACSSGAHSAVCGSP